MIQPDNVGDDDVPAHTVGIHLISRVKNMFPPPPLALFETLSNGIVRAKRRRRKK